MQHRYLGNISLNIYKENSRKENDTGSSCDAEIVPTSFLNT
jgi:hypothetical protein